MSNALQPIFDLCWESGRIFFTWLFDGWIQPKINLDDFFIAANIKNSLGEYPRVVKNNRTVFNRSRKYSKTFATRLFKFSFFFF